MSEQSIPKPNGGDAAAAAAARVSGAGAPKIHWDDSKMRSAYANVCNVGSTREEIFLLFGVSQAWDGANPENEVTIKLSDRMILSPFAAKRLHVLLTNTLAQYEQRFGVLSVGRPESRDAAAS